MNIRHILPSDIEKESFRIIKKELDELGKEIPEELLPTVQRVIHTTADFEYAETLCFSKDVISKAVDAIRAGAHIVTDTNMALSGISKKTLQKYGGEVHCFMADEDIAAAAKERGVTRAYVSMDKAAEIQAPLIFAIGNAPTALIRLYELIKENRIKPLLIIGVPVGFVNVVEAKELIMESGVPYIVNRGRKGGSTVAAAICNSILYNMDNKLRSGFTTGSCAAAASKAALTMLITGEDIHNVSIATPKGIPYYAEIIDIERDKDTGEVSCAVIKDGGDDPDVTTGSRIESTVSFTDDEAIIIDGGAGVGRVTKPGLDQPIGEAAINSVPRKMIRENIEEVLMNNHMSGRGVKVMISVPGGEELAKRTFNPKLGIVGGISILGTTGIVEPMSDSALVETIRTEINVRAAEGRNILLAAPGNYGLDFLHEKYGMDKELAVMSSNFIYDTVKMAEEAGFTKMLFAGHIGKLVKVAGGIKNTHSMYGDHRMEILSEITKYVSGSGEEQSISGSGEDQSISCSEEDQSISCSGENQSISATEKSSDYDNHSQKLRGKILDCVMTDEAVRIIKEAGLGDQVFTEMAKRIKNNMESWTDGRLQVEIIVFANENTELVATGNAHKWMTGM